MKSCVVFCGSSAGTDKSFTEIAYITGKFLAMHNVHVIYGGAKIGLMGAVADGALQNGGRVTGVLPDFLGSKEIAHDKLTELIIVKSMHERKLRMHELSEAVIGLPGGFGTMEELFEMLTWAQLGLHSKPIGVLNHKGFYNHLMQLADTMRSSGLLNPQHRKLVIDADTISTLYEKMNHYQATKSSPKISLLKT